MPRPIHVCLLVLASGIALAQPPRKTGQSQQGLVTVTPPIDQATQLQFGLLSLTNPEGSCSASMLNDYWAITAAHCVFSRNGACPQFTPNQVSLQANWPGNTKTVQVRQIVPFGTPATCPSSLLGNPSDVAILQVGFRDFNRPDSRPMKLHDQRPMANLPVTAYGRGINALAFQAGPTAVPSSSDNQYRSANFDIISITPNSALPPRRFGFPGNRGATVAAGDSGGPSYIQDWDDPLSVRRKLEWRLIGVHSSCATTCLPGQSCPATNPWQWVSAVQQCSDAAIFPLRAQILAAIEAVPPNTDSTGTFPTGVPNSVLRQKRALYALSLDEPLIAPANAAQDIQLTFKRCSGAQVISGCPVTPDLEQWAYDPSTRRLLHAASGKCVNISGARRDAGSPIILFPCVNAPNEKWSLVRTGTSPIWSIKSDQTGMCLHAQPGRTAAGRAGPLGRVGLPAPATLVQMPCNGSDAQRFDSVDKDWTRRNGPR